MVARVGINTKPVAALKLDLKSKALQNGAARAAATQMPANLYVEKVSVSNRFMGNITNIVDRYGLGGVINNTSTTVRNSALYKLASQLIANLFGEAKEAKAAIDAAVERGDTKTAVATASASLKKNRINTEGLTEQQILDAFDQLYTKLETATRTGDIEGFIAGKNELKSQLAALANRTNSGFKITATIQVKMNAVIEIETRGTAEFDVRIKSGIELIQAQPATAQGETKVNELAAKLEALHAPDPSIKASSEQLGAQADVIAGIDANIAESQDISRIIIQVATEKGYRLNNFDQLAVMAGAIETSPATEVYATSDMAQIRALSDIKVSFSNLTQAVLDLLASYRAEAKKLDEESAKIMLANKREELKEIERGFEKKIQDKKLKAKLLAQALDLSYQLKVPGELTQARLELLIDAINKIKWQVITSKMPQ